MLGANFTSVYWVQLFPYWKRSLSSGLTAEKRSRKGTGGLPDTGSSTDASGRRGPGVAVQPQRTHLPCLTLDRLITGSPLLSSVKHMWKGTVWKLNIDLCVRDRAAEQRHIVSGRFASEKCCLLQSQTKAFWCRFVLCFHLVRVVISWRKVLGAIRGN